MECLVTKLRGTINDASLPKLGAVKLTLIEGESSGQLAFENGEMRVLRGSVTITQNGTPVALPMQGIISGTYNIVVGQGGAEVEFLNKYQLRRIDLLNSVLPPTDVTNISYCKELLSMNMGLVLQQSASAAKGFVGDIKNLEGASDIREMLWGGPLCGGKIEDFAKFAKLTYLRMYFGAVTGAVEDLVAAYRANGRTTGTITFAGTPTGLTYKGVLVSANQSKTLSWTATEITL